MCVIVKSLRSDSDCNKEATYLHIYLLSMTAKFIITAFIGNILNKQMLPKSSVLAVHQKVSNDRKSLR